jgi:hypothetical protein
LAFGDYTNRTILGQIPPYENQGKYYASNSIKQHHSASIFTTLEVLEFAEKVWDFDAVFQPDL